ncbi:MAG: response regulator transcription factor [Mycoplasma sp.]|nr:response regulator transcription factor [Mycoplasma sp.]
MNKSKMLQVYLLTTIKTKNQEKIIEIWKEIFNISVNYIKKEELPKLKNKKSDLLFIFEKSATRKDVNWEFINDIRKKNPYFKLIWIMEKFNSLITPPFLKAGADDMLYLDSGFEYIKWKTIALLRRRWDLFANDNIIFHRGLIIDKLKGECMLNENIIDLSRKEFEVLKVLADAIGEKYVERDYIYKTVWKNNDKDTTRVVQQIIQNLKKKIGSDYFKTIRSKGIKLN